MSAELVIHPSTKLDIESYLNDPSQAIALIGPEGSGKTALAIFLAEKILDAASVEATNNGRLFVVEPEPGKEDISIDAVRKLILKLSLKPGRAGAKRVVLITDANRLGGEAQNALLKTIEEPDGSTFFILTMPTLNSVAGTITSRLEKIEVRPINLNQSLTHYGKSHQNKNITSAWQLSKGRPGLLYKLLNNSTEPLKISTSDAKVFLALNRYDRLLFLENISKDRSAFLDFLNGLSRVLEAVNHSYVARGQLEQAKKLVLSRKELMSIRKMLLANASQKFATLHLVNSLKV